MDAYYFDSSGLVKRFTREKGTAWVLNLFKPSNRHTIYIARITPVEVIAALTRQNRIGTISVSELDKSTGRFVRSLQSRFAFVEISDNLVRAAMTLAKDYSLRGYDAVQLAAALQIHRRRKSLNLSPLIFVSADNNLNAAASAESLAVENPNNYP